MRFDIRRDEGLIPAHAGKTTRCPAARPAGRAHPRSRGENQRGQTRDARPPGSSPLTRGKPPVRQRRQGHPGLIPAHAGKTDRTSRATASARAHPRSRGENATNRLSQISAGGSSPLTRGKRDGRPECLRARRLIPAHAGKTQIDSSAGNRDPGSSPLTRGKLISMILFSLVIGLIPAHAGKTHRPCRRAPGGWAHPRSRGENSGGWMSPRTGKGSSPLTRGKHCEEVPDRLGAGLIPAHAGKTLVGAPGRGGAGAHPRSRGENSVSPPTRRSQRGSSPLTRGKPVRASRCLARLGLIPAHAGKTRPAPEPGAPPPAHPRSRGENVTLTASDNVARGSSPLTRGKPTEEDPHPYVLGLIPAHAGKTLPPYRRRSTRWAHPRSRGENLGGRGPRWFGTRLIPAHAGKTPVLVVREVQAWAHPRSRGENIMEQTADAHGAGSSPLTRGKPRANENIRLGYGLIPAHAGKTAAEGGPS